jgi:hypothetical protein
MPVPAGRQGQGHDFSGHRAESARAALRGAKNIAQRDTWGAEG